MGILPFFHVFAMTAVMNRGIANGAMMILVPRFELTMGLKLIRKDRPTVMPGVPTSIQRSGIHRTQAGRPGFAEILRFRRRAPAGRVEAQFREGFRASTWSRAMACPRPRRAPPAIRWTAPVKEGSIGIPMPRHQHFAALAGRPGPGSAARREGRDLHRRTPGHEGLLEQPEETGGVMVGEFFRTGDVGYHGR